MHTLWILDRIFGDRIALTSGFHRRVVGKELGVVGSHLAAGLSPFSRESDGTGRLVEGIGTEFFSELHLILSPFLLGEVLVVLTVLLGKQFQ